VAEAEPEVNTATRVANLHSTLTADGAYRMMLA